MLDDSTLDEATVAAIAATIASLMRYAIRRKDVARHASFASREKRSIVKTAQGNNNDAVYGSELIAY